MVLLTLLGGCQSWRPTAVAPRQFISEEAPETVRMTLTDGRTLTMSGPRVESDSIVGVTESGTTRIAAGDLSTLEVRRPSPTRTIALALVHASAVVTLIALIVAVQPHYSGF